MRTFLLLLTAFTMSLSAMAQKIIKVVPVEEMKDSVVYQGDNAILVFDRQYLQDYMITMDTTLRNNRAGSKIFRNIQFSRLNNSELATHFQKAYCYLEDSLNRDLSYRTDRMNLLWSEDQGILMPYIEEILADLLTSGRLKVIERSNKAVQPAYKLIFEPIENSNYRVFRLNNGKEIFRESTFCVEQITTYKAKA
ncbi:hypothetical protein [Chitinophaga solisilvae]|uniref:Uncharacterized protein n=1 Tax=Chitinophaga solisilvae TaxID=1233460 RepID=A0A3S1AYS6_9BACT|nr:hypothetical protein [Chitinophaga solisilvae]NSL90584.1 hypothetical protein [Chitinophaga solisilvae]